MYHATIKKPFHPPTSQQSGNLRELMREIRKLVITSPHGTSAGVESVEGNDRMQVARYENVEGKLRKVV